MADRNTTFTFTSQEAFALAYSDLARQRDTLHALVKHADSMTSLLWHRFVRKTDVPLDVVLDMDNLLADLRAWADDPTRSGARMLSRQP